MLLHFTYYLDLTLHRQQRIEPLLASFELVLVHPQVILHPKHCSLHSKVVQTDRQRSQCIPSLHNQSGLPNLALEVAAELVILSTMTWYMNKKATGYIVTTLLCSDQEGKKALRIRSYLTIKT